MGTTKVEIIDGPDLADFARSLANMENWLAVWPKDRVKPAEVWVTEYPREGRYTTLTVSALVKRRWPFRDRVFDASVSFTHSLLAVLGHCNRWTPAFGEIEAVVTELRNEMQLRWWQRLARWWRRRR